MSRHVAVVPGDLAGQEVIPEAVKVLRACGLGYELEEYEVGAAPVLRGEPAMSERTFREVSRADAILFGAIGDPRVPELGYAAQVLLRMRFELDLYVNLRPARLYDDRLSPLRDPARRPIDLLIVRENTEGLYVGMGGRFKRGTEQEVAIQEDVNTHLGVGRIDILSDLTAGLIGGMGLAPSANVNPETGRALFEPVHGSAPNIAGQGIVNPLGAILTAGMMAEHLGDEEAAKRIEAAVIGAIREGECTRDLGGSRSTSEAGDAVVERLKD